MEWKRIPVFKGKPGSELDIRQPAGFAAMVETARALCGDFPFVRVDLYSPGGRLVFGEFTFYPDGGTIPFTPDRYNTLLGDLFVLPAARPETG